VVTATKDRMQCYCVVFGDFFVTATVDIVQCYRAPFGDYCGYSNSICRATVLWVWSMLWLQQQQIY